MSLQQITYRNHGKLPSDRLSGDISPVTLLLAGHCTISTGMSESQDLGACTFSLPFGYERVISAPQERV